MIVIRSKAPVVQTLIPCAKCNDPRRLVPRGAKCAACDSKERKAAEARNSAPAPAAE